MAQLLSFRDRKATWLPSVGKKGTRLSYVLRSETESLSYDNLVIERLACCIAMAAKCAL